MSHITRGITQKITKQERKTLGITKQQALQINNLYKAREKLQPVNLNTSNLLMQVDSYKVSHWLQFPEGTESSFYYVESRGGRFDKLMVAGVHYLTELLSRGITLDDVNEADEFYQAHFGQQVFNREGWLRIVNEFGGRLPITIRAIPEGTVVPVKNAILTVETEDGFGWLAGYLETFILRAIWYPTTVATISFDSKKVIAEAMERTCDLPADELQVCLGFRLHDFGSRGVSSSESSAIGGLAHLYNFCGTDNVEALMLARALFDTPMAGFSIPAREHSTTTCYLREGEYKAFMNSVHKFGGGIFAVVIDSYSTEKALEWLTTNKEFIKVLTEKGGVCVLRPDSGLPIDMVKMCLDAVARNVGYEFNTKGFKVIDSRFRVIQGDGVNEDAIKRIVSWITAHCRYSMECFNFGQGGGLLQHCDRDWLRFAMKCSAMKVNGVWRDVYKSPETDPSKKSKAGRLDCINVDGEYRTVVLEEHEYCLDTTAMRTVFHNGQRTNLQTLEDIRCLSDNQAKVITI